MNFFEGRVDDGVFRAGDLAIDLTGYAFTPTGQTGGPAWFGIRPENVAVDGDGPVQITVVADIVEPMGADTLVWTKVEGEPFRIRMDGTSTVKVGDTLNVSFDPAHGSMFDKASEERL
jgi:multiple sugar transport system ATP-binding protein